MLSFNKTRLIESLICDGEPEKGRQIPRSKDGKPAPFPLVLAPCLRPYRVFSRESSAYVSVL